jgi:hypothetical protein
VACHEVVLEDQFGEAIHPQPALPRSGTACPPSRLGRCPARYIRCRRSRGTSVVRSRTVRPGPRPCSNRSAGPAGPPSPGRTGPGPR